MKKKPEEKLGTLPRVIRDRTPRWKVLNVKTLVGTGFPSEDEAKQEMIAHQYIAIWWKDHTSRPVTTIAGAVYDFAHLLAKNPEIVKEILKSQENANEKASN